MSYEPLNPTCDDVIAFLESSRRPRMAEFLRFLSGQAKRFGEQRLSYEGRIRVLLARLAAYEPPADMSPPPDFRPPPESSD